MSLSEYSSPGKENVLLTLTSDAHSCCGGGCRECPPPMVQNRKYPGYGNIQSGNDELKSLILALSTQLDMFEVKVNNSRQSRSQSCDSFRQQKRDKSKEKSGNQNLC